MCYFCLTLLPPHNFKALPEVVYLTMHRQNEDCAVGVVCEVSVDVFDAVP